MKVMHESKEYKDYFDEVQGYYYDKERKQQPEPIGSRLKKFREMQNFSLKRFAEISGIDETRILKIEEQSIFPDLGTVMKLSKALRVATGLLLGDEAGYSYSIVRNEDRKNIKRFSTGTKEKTQYHYQSLASGINDRHMESFIITLDADSDTADLSTHEGEEFIVVMEGTIKVILGNKEEVLKVGDSIYYFSTIPHAVVNNTKGGNAVIMAVIYVGN